mgnify:CR=1 FL=1
MKSKQLQPFFDYEGKYEMVDSHIYCPARISPKLFEEAREIAKRHIVP